MRLQPRDFLADIAVLRGRRRLLIEPLLIDRQVFEQFADALVEVLHYLDAGLLGQLRYFRHRGLNVAHPGRKVVVEAATLTDALDVESFERARERLLSERECGPRIMLLLDHVENFGTAQDPTDLGIAIEMKPLAESAQLRNVEVREVVVHFEAHRRRFHRNRFDKHFDPAARHHALHGLADLRLVLAPSAWHRELQFEEALIERAHFGYYAGASMLGNRSAEPGHTFHWFEPLPPRFFSSAAR